MDEQASPETLDPVPEQSPRYPTRRARGPWARAALAALHINLRCLAILTALFVVLLAILAISARGEGSLADSAGILTMAWGIHLAAVVVVGYPLGVVTSRLLPADASLLAASAAFAAVGGVSGALLTASFGFGAAPLIWFALGAVTAGGARAWAHRAIQAQSSPATGAEPELPAPLGMPS